MENFSFATTAGTSQSNVKPRLTGNNIHTVVFDGCESADIQGVKHPEEVYKVLKLRWSNAEGYFEHTVFEPQSPKGFERTQTEYVDKKTGEKKMIPQASAVENVMLLFKHAIDTINPSIGKKIDEGNQTLTAKTWDELRLLVAKILNAGKGTKCEIKLLKDQNGEARFPSFFTSINKDGKAYVRNNFIGTNLMFTPYEKTRIAAEESAKPTKVADYSPANSPAMGDQHEADLLDLSFEMPNF
jgi:hypothetical protein